MNAFTFNEKTQAYMVDQCYTVVHDTDTELRIWKMSMFLEYLYLNKRSGKHLLKFTKDFRFLAWGHR